PLEVRLGIFEPPRFFEALLRGRSFREAPDITARICGICPVAYITSASNALESILGIQPTPGIRALRRLLYCGEWIESHALHVFLLHLPDFLGFPDAITMAAKHGDLVKKALHIKKVGNGIVTCLGGREIHPVGARVGGFYKAPTRASLQALLPGLRTGRAYTLEALEALSGIPFPDLERDVEFVAMQHPEEYPMAEGRIVSSKGLDIDVCDYDRYFAEEHVQRSNALHSRVKGRGAYLTGPLARFNLNFERLSPDVQKAARQAKIPVPCLNPFKSILVRLVETLQAFDDAVRIIESYEPPAPPFVDAPVRAGKGWGVSEAPRGILVHRYTIDAEGTIQDAKIVPPTAQNQLAMEEDLTALAPDLLSMPIEQATVRAEQALRNYDPCISCATHFLNLRIERR
ncbi:MAG: nickel-dependent hydrogenase large subunit, partial [Planctomycetota bacterium]